MLASHPTMHKQPLVINQALILELTFQNQDRDLAQSWIKSGSLHKLAHQLLVIGGQLGCGLSTSLLVERGHLPRRWGSPPA